MKLVIKQISFTEMFMKDEQWWIVYRSFEIYQPNVLTFYGEICLCNKWHHSLDYTKKNSAFHHVCKKFLQTFLILQKRRSLNKHFVWMIAGNNFVNYFMIGKMQKFHWTITLIA